MIEIVKDQPIFKMLKWVFIAAQSKRDKTRPSLNCLNVERGEEFTHFICVDGHRLHKWSEENTIVDNALKSGSHWQTGLYRLVTAGSSEIILDYVTDGSIHPVDYNRIFPVVTEESHKTIEMFVGFKPHNVSTSFCKLILALNGAINYKYFVDSLPSNTWTVNVPKVPTQVVSFYNERMHVLIMPLRLMDAE